MSNLCKDCKYFRKSYVIWPLHSGLELGKCANPKTNKVSMITGKPKTGTGYASVIREFDCQGNWFEHKKDRVWGFFDDL